MLELPCDEVNLTAMVVAVRCALALSPLQLVRTRAHVGIFFVDADGLLEALEGQLGCG